MKNFLRSLFGPHPLTDKELFQLIHDRKALPVDVRTEEEYLQGSVPGSVNIPLDQMQLRYRELPQDRPLVIYCASGRRSHKAMEILEEKGFKDIHDGKEWRRVLEIVTK